MIVSPHPLSIDYQQKVKAAQATGGEAQQELMKKFFPNMEPSSVERSISSGSNQSDPREKEEEKMDEEKELEKEGGEEETMEEEADDPFLPAERPVQKNKKRCWTCRVKLELAKRQLGTCKCGKSRLIVLDKQV